MRRLLVMGIAAVLAVSVAMPADAASLRPTTRTVVRPVTASGHAVNGWRVVKESGGVDCSFPQASPAAVDPDILFCSPDAAYAVACWRSATPHHVLCLRDARTHKLAKLPVLGKIAHTTPYRIRGPLDLRLRNGLTCTLRAGGAGATLHQHPQWAVYYYCTHNQAIWAPMNAKNWGINRFHPVWTAHVGRADGTGKVAVRRVARVWLVGTQH